MNLENFNFKSVRIKKNVLKFGTKVRVDDVDKIFKFLQEIGVVNHHSWAILRCDKGKNKIPQIVLLTDNKARELYAKAVFKHTSEYIDHYLFS